MEDGRKRMTASKTSKVNKLLRVLVVGGVALAGAPGSARADDKPAGEEQKTAKAAEKAQAKAKAGDKAKDKEKAKEQAAKDKAAEKGEAEGSGVKGW